MDQALSNLILVLGGNDDAAAGLKSYWRVQKQAPNQETWRGTRVLRKLVSRGECCKQLLDF